jgi:hypothetical protein
MKVTTEVNGILVEINATRIVNLSGLNAFIESMGEVKQPAVTVTKPVKRGRGRPPGAKNKGARK